MRRAAGALALLGVMLAEQAARATAALEDPGGVPVTFVCKDPSMEIFLARGDVPAGAVPDPFVRVGLAPLTLHLAPGKYSIETASPTTSTGHDHFEVEHDSPLTVEVRPGDATVKVLGEGLVVLGVVALVLGIVAVMSISPNDQHYDRFAVGLPLAIGGAAGVGVGVGMIFLGSTEISVPHLPPGMAPKGAHPAMGAGITLRW